MKNWTTAKKEKANFSYKLDAHEVLFLHFLKKISQII